jgi:myo-inositol-1(or 4)-monophosphatase
MTASRQQSAKSSSGANDRLADLRMTKTMSPELTTAEDAARAGGQIVARYFRDGVTMRHKAKVDLVSDADIEAEHAIVAVIRESFPDHAIMGEESHAADASAQHLWIVDPLDGTTNFAHGLPHFGVSIAYYQNGQAQCGAILNPITNDWYVARRGHGATFNGQPVHVSKHDTLNQVLVGAGFYYDRGAMMEATLAAIGELFHQDIHGIRRMGAAALDLCMVATGQYGGFFEYQLSPWDFAAGRLFVEEAGGKVTTCRGDALPLAQTSVLATNGVLHDSMLGIVGRHCR